MWTKRLLFLLMTAASFSFASAQFLSWKRIKGNKKVQIEERHIDRFDRLIVKGSMEVKVQQGPSAQPLTVEAESNILPLVVTAVEDGVLIIKMKSTASISINKGVRIRVTTPHLTEVELHGSGDIIFSGLFRQPSLRIGLFGSGDITFANATIANDLDISLRGSGDVRGKIFAGRNAVLSLTGSGDIDVSLGLPQSVRANLSGSGDIKIKGETAYAALQCNGSGDLECRHLLARQADVRIHGSGDGKLAVAEKLDINLSGSAGFVCYGKPVIGTKKVSRSSSFRMVP